MQSRDFCYWLQGFFELSGEVNVISAEQATTIRRHLDMVFHHALELEEAEVLAREKPTKPTPVPEPPVAPSRPKEDAVPGPDPRREPLPTPLC